MLDKTKISNSNLVFRKKLDWLSDKKLYGLDLKKLELVLLDRISVQDKK